MNLCIYLIYLFFEFRNLGMQIVVIRWVSITDGHSTLTIFLKLSIKHKCEMTVLAFGDVMREFSPHSVEAIPRSTAVDVLNVLLPRRQLHLLSLLLGT